MKQFLLIAILSVPFLAAAQAGGPQSPLPKNFGGWERGAPPEISVNPGAADKLHAGLLKEYGFTDFHTAIYTRPERKLHVKAIRFRDASGSYGAFTFYKSPGMQTESIGDQGASANERILFYRGNILVQVMLDRVTPMSAGELRELANELPLPSGPARNLPVLPGYLPKQRYVANTAKYVSGPMGLQAIGSLVTAELVNFGTGAEVVTGQYQTGGGLATLTLIAYPTPGIAGERLKAVESALPTQSNQDSKQRVASKRSGPILAIVSGAVPLEEAKDLLALINFDAEVTWNEATPTGKNSPISLMWSLAMLTVGILGLALVAGIAFGGVRLLLKKLYPGRVFDRPEDVEIIQLKLQ